MDTSSERRQSIQSKIGEVECIRHNARYTLEAYTEESKAIKQSLVLKQHYAAYIDGGEGSVGSGGVSRGEVQCELL